MSADPIAPINDAIENAVAAQEIGDYVNALRHLETAYLRIIVLPNSEFNNERLEWKPDAILAAINHLKTRISAGAGTGQPRDCLIVSNPIIYKRG